MRKAGKVSSAPLGDVVRHMDHLLETASIPDYPNAVNGLQMANAGQVTRVAAAVDFSSRTIESAISEKADLLIVHHGMFWPGLEPLTGIAYDRLKQMMDAGLAVYSSHLPLDRHPRLGNNVLLASELQLEPNAGFARFQTIDIGVRGDTDMETAEIAARAGSFSKANGGSLRTTPIAPGRGTRRWAICTGSGASADTLRECAQLGVDTLIVGEGAHWTAVHAADNDLVIMYAGHYATETLGVRALAEHVASHFSLPWRFLHHPTGL